VSEVRKLTRSASSCELRPAKIDRAASGHAVLTGSLKMLRKAVENFGVDSLVEFFGRTKLPKLSALRSQCGGM
jgi:hypothetical protein